MNNKEDTTAIITSAAYVNLEIAAEFGKMPPSFLPMGHKRLFSWQIDRLKEIAGRVFISLPHDYELSEADAAELDSKGVQICRIQSGIALGESLSRALILTESFKNTIVLHGDTFFLGDIPSGTDWASVAPPRAGYSWGAADTSGQFYPSSAKNQRETVLTGLFSFSSGLQLAKSLILAGGDFLAGLSRYSSFSPLASTPVEGWLDFGHLQTFYRSRAAVSTARSFNTISVQGNEIKKFGTNNAKIAAEAGWFASVPQPLRLFSPVYLGTTRNEIGAEGYRLGYEFSPTLHELYVFGSLQQDTWRAIFDACFNFFEICESFAPSSPRENALEELVLHKTRARLNSLRTSPELGLDEEWRYAGKLLPSPVTIAERTANYIVSERLSVPAVMHGDFCFPNIFYNFRDGLVKVIDPRGSVKDGDPSIFGDLLYDLAKLNHSVEGYDLILADRHKLTGFDERDVRIDFSNHGAALWLREISAEYGIHGIKLSSGLVTALTIQLFLSMIPLHADRPDRQRAFLANALRLYASLDENGAVL